MVLAYLAFFQNFLAGRGGGAKSIVTQISFVMLLFSDQISGGGKSLQAGGQTASGEAPPVEGSQRIVPFCYFTFQFIVVKPDVVLGQICQQ